MRRRVAVGSAEGNVIIVVVAVAAVVCRVLDRYRVFCKEAFP